MTRDHHALAYFTNTEHFHLTCDYVISDCKLAQRYVCYDLYNRILQRLFNYTM